MSIRQQKNAIFPLFTLFFALLPWSTTLALSDKALSLIGELKNKTSSESTLEKPIDTTHEPDLNAAPPVLPPPTPEPTVPKNVKPVKPAPAAASPGEMQTGDPDSAPPAKQKSRKSRKNQEEKKASEEPEKAAPTKAAPPSLRSSEASELIKRIMEKLDSTRRSIAGTVGSEIKKANEPKPKIDSTAPKTAKITSVKPADSAAIPANTGSSSGQRSFGELTDEELIQYARDHVWSSEKSRRHNPPWTPPSKSSSKKKKKAETAKPATKGATPAAKSGTAGKSPGSK